MRDEDLIDLTPEIHKEAIDIVAKYDHGPLFTPPSQRGTIQVPGIGGGANWSGAAIDPETGMLYVSTYRLPFVVTVRKPQPGEASYDFVGNFRYLPGPRGLPLLKPPFGSIVAIDMNSGEHRWRIPVGRDDIPIRNSASASELGYPARSLGTGHQDRLDRGSDGRVTARRTTTPRSSARSPISATSIRICGFTTRPAATCWRRSRCRPMRRARR